MVDAGRRDRDALLALEELLLLQALARYIDAATLAQILGAADPSPSPVMRAALIAQLSRSAALVGEDPETLPPAPDQRATTWSRAMEDPRAVVAVSSLHAVWEGWSLAVDDGQLVVSDQARTMPRPVTRAPSERRALCAILSGLRALDGLATTLPTADVQTARSWLVDALRVLLEDARHFRRPLDELVRRLTPGTPAPGPDSPIAAVVDAVDRYARERETPGTEPRPQLLTL